MKTIIPAEHSVSDIQRLITSSIGPRPIALVSTISDSGIRNLAPFSFFNAFSGNPPTVIFSPSRKGRDASLKDTYHNVKATKECVIGIVSIAMVEQVSLASSEYSSDVDEFIKSGLTPIKSKFIKSYGIKESPIWVECKVNQIIELGDLPGAGNLVIAEILAFHIDDDIIDGFVIDPNKLKAVGRFGENYYVTAFGSALFKVDKPVGKGIGIDQLPDFMRNSKQYTGNHLGRFANVEQIPEKESILKFINECKRIEYRQSKFTKAEQDRNPEKMLSLALSTKINRIELLERTAISFLENKQFENAWKTALIVNLK